MEMGKEYRDLGMGRPIARRDFLQGVAVGITGAYVGLHDADPVAALQEATSHAAGASTYPPLLTGLRGNYPEAVDEFSAIRQGAYSKFPVADADIHEEFDLVIVGGGISGLSAAYFYRAALGAGQRILILDNHDDFGGHAKRNEFRREDRTFIGFGGSRSLTTPLRYSFCAKALVKELGIDVDRHPELVNRVLQTKYNLVSGIFFDKDHFLEDRLVVGNPRRPRFFDEVPLSDEARNDLIRLFGKNSDYMAGLSQHEKKASLAKMSYQDYLLKVARVHPDAIAFFLGQGGRNNKRVDTMPALEEAQYDGVGFDGLGLEFEIAVNEGFYRYHFPDGNASVARLLVSNLVPSAFPYPQSVNTIVTAPLAYDRLDDPNSTMRIRLSSPVIRVIHDGSPESASSVRVAYMHDHKARAVRGRYCILACYNHLIPSLMPELADRQKEALAYPVKVPMMYTNVLIRCWTAFANLGVSRITAPGMYYTELELDPGAAIGSYQGVTTPDEPVLVHMMRNPNKPGLPRKKQNLAGQRELLSTTFEEFELHTRRQLKRILGSSGFDPSEDVVAITVNRWPYGYAYAYDTLADPEMLEEERPHVIGRQRFGRVAIANSDAGAAAYLNQAIEEANRAVTEILMHMRLT